MTFSLSNMNKSGRAALARSKSIDHQIDEERERRQREVQLLILEHILQISPRLNVWTQDTLQQNKLWGPANELQKTANFIATSRAELFKRGAGSGKSTFIKQLRLHYGDGFPDAERGKFVNNILQNCANGLHIILEHMKVLGVNFENEESKRVAVEFKLRHPRISLQAILNKFSEVDDAQDDESMSLCSQLELTKRLSKLNILNPEKPDVQLLQAVWNDSGVQCCYAQRKKFMVEKLSNGEEHFLENLDRVCRKQFIPSVYDIMLIRCPTLGVQEHKFTIDNLIYRVIDVAGQKSLRKKWIHFFECVTAVVFFASVDGYDEVLEEDPMYNSLQDSIQAFHEVSHNHFLEKTDFVLFLNKKDLFMEKVKKSSIKTCFPSYKGDLTAEASLKFIKDQFLQHKPGHKQVYIHVSCAIDTSLMKDILANVIDIIVELNLRKAGSF